MKSTTPLFVSSVVLIACTIDLEFVLPAGPWWLLVRIALPLLVLIAISWAFGVFLRAGQLPRWWPSSNR